MGKEKMHSGDDNWYKYRRMEDSIKSSTEYGSQERKDAMDNLRRDVNSHVYGEDADYFIKHHTE